jgi:uncharacterized membrane protein
MYWILFVMGGIAALAIALIVGGLVTARSHVVTRELTVRAPAAAVFATIHDVARYADWRQELESSELLDDDQGLRRWRENSTRGSVTYGIVEDIAPSRFVARTLDEDLALRAEWHWQVSEVDGATRVQLTQRGEIGNPIARFVAAHVTGHAVAIDRCLESLASHVGEPGARIVDSARR